MPVGVSSMPISKSSCITYPVLIASLALILSCGGAAPDRATPSDAAVSDTVRLTGRVDVPPLEALPALQSRMRLIKEMNGEDATKGVKGDLHTLDGNHLGSFETVIFMLK